jgi:hypothetical protein
MGQCLNASEQCSIAVHERCSDYAALSVITAIEVIDRAIRGYVLETTVNQLKLTHRVQIIKLSIHM